MKGLIGFFLIPVYTFHLSTEDYGNLQYILAFGQLCIAIIGMGIESAFWKFRSRSTDYSQGEVIFNGVFSQILVGITILMISLVAKYTFAERSVLAKFIILYLVAQLVSVIYKNTLLILRANFRAKFYILVSISQALLLACLNIFFVAYLKMNYQGIIYSNLITATLISISFYYILHREFAKGINWSLTNAMIRYGFPLAVGNIAAFVITLSDRFFLKAYAGPAELGLYAFGDKFAGLVRMLLIMPFFLSWNPIRWEIYEMENGKEIFSKFNRLFLAFLPALGLFIISGAIFLGNFMTVNKEYLFGFRITIILAFSHVLYGLYYFNSMGMLFKNKTKTIAWIIIISGLLNLLFNSFLIPPFGMLGASAATIMSYFTMFILGRFYSQKYYPIQRRTYFEAIHISLIFGYVLVLTILFYKVENIYTMAFLPFCAAIFHIMINMLFNNTFRTEINNIFSKISGLVLAYKTK